MVYTPIKGTTSGGHFYIYEAMHLTELALSYDASYDTDNTKRESFGTNASHPDSARYISRMALALPHIVTCRSECGHHAAIITQLNHTSIL
jgi:hypothetical protein